MDYSKLTATLIVALIASLIIPAIMQKIKKSLKSKKNLELISMIVSIIIGCLFALSYSDLQLVYCFWAGIFSIIGTSGIYQILENKIFKSYSSMQETITVPAKDVKSLEELKNEVQ